MWFDMVVYANFVTTHGCIYMYLIVLANVYSLDINAFLYLTWLYVHVFECACKHISKVCKQFKAHMIRYSVREYIILLFHTCVKLLFTWRTFPKKKKQSMYFGDDSSL